jgi:mono/diheme cytochrome c family protein
VGEGAAAPTDETQQVSQANQPKVEAQPTMIGAMLPQFTSPQFTAMQAAEGKSSYNSNCAVCHGSTMTNGTFGPPLAGGYFRNKWLGQSVGAFYGHARTMPPAVPASLRDETYAEIVAYILEVNGFKPASIKLPPGGEALDKMTIRR